MNWKFDSMPEPDGIPDFLRRDANNRAPFMKCNYPNCDGGPATGYCGNECRDVHPPLATPAMAPFAEELCEDEGCPQHGTPHVCVTPVTGPPASPPNWVPPWASK